MKPIFLIGEAWGEHEEKLAHPFVGASGAELFRMLAEARVINLTDRDKYLIHEFYKTKSPKNILSIWKSHPELFATNVFQARPPKNDLSWFLGPKSDGIPGYPPLKISKGKFPGTHVRAEFFQELDRLGDEILQVDPNIIICLGNAALWAMAGRTAITKWRGATLMSTHTVEGYKLLPTLHPAYIIRQTGWSDRPVVIADFMKASREAMFPEIRRPERELWIEPTLNDIAKFIVDHIHGCELLSVDIETAGNRITCIGLGPKPGLGIVIPFDDGRKKNGCYWLTKAEEFECWGLIKGVLEEPSIPKLFQNGLYDIAFLYRSMKIKVFGATHDTMLMAHAQQPESLKGLGFLGSIYSDEGSWKHLGKVKTIKRED